MNELDKRYFRDNRKVVFLPAGLGYEDHSGRLPGSHYRS